MSETRTKVEALKDLGEKVTGSTIEVGENETAVKKEPKEKAVKEKVVKPATKSTKATKKNAKK